MTHDNQKFDVSAKDSPSLERVLQLAFDLAGHPYAVGFLGRQISVPRSGLTKVDDSVCTLSLLWTMNGPGEMQRLPAKTNALGCLGLVQAWLSECPRGIQPDHDGSNSKGYRVFVEHGKWFSICSIQPYWLMYGK